MAELPTKATRSAEYAKIAELVNRGELVSAEGITAQGLRGALDRLVEDPFHTQIDENKVAWVWKVPGETAKPKKAKTSATE